MTGMKIALLAIVGAGTAGGMATGAYFFLQPKNIKDLLIRDNLRPLNVDKNSKVNDSEWDKLVSKHTTGTTPISLKNNVQIKKL